MDRRIVGHESSVCDSSSESGNETDNGNDGDNDTIIKRENGNKISKDESTFALNDEKREKRTNVGNNKENKEYGNNMAGNNNEREKEAMNDSEMKQENERKEKKNGNGKENVSDIGVTRRGQKRLNRSWKQNENEEDDSKQETGNKGQIARYLTQQLTKQDRLDKQHMLHEGLPGGDANRPAQRDFSRYQGKSKRRQLRMEQQQREMNDYGGGQRGKWSKDLYQASVNKNEFANKLLNINNELKEHSEWIDDKLKGIDCDQGDDTTKEKSKHAKHSEHSKYNTVNKGGKHSKYGRERSKENEKSKDKKRDKNKKQARREIKSNDETMLKNLIDIVTQITECRSEIARITQQRSSLQNQLTQVKASLPTLADIDSGDSIDMVYGAKMYMIEQILMTMSEQIEMKTQKLVWQLQSLSQLKQAVSPRKLKVIESMLQVMNQSIDNIPQIPQALSMNDTTTIVTSGKQKGQKKSKHEKHGKDNKDRKHSKHDSERSKETRQNKKKRKQNGKSKEKRDKKEKEGKKERKSNDTSVLSKLKQDSKKEKEREKDKSKGKEKEMKKEKEKSNERENVKESSKNSNDCESAQHSIGTPLMNALADDMIDSNVTNISRVPHLQLVGFANSSQIPQVHAQPAQPAQPAQIPQAPSMNETSCQTPRTIEQNEIDIDTAIATADAAARMTCTNVTSMNGIMTPIANGCNGNSMGGQLYEMNYHGAPYVFSGVNDINEITGINTMNGMNGMNGMNAMNRIFEESEQRALPKSPTSLAKRVPSGTSTKNSGNGQNQDQSEKDNDGDKNSNGDNGANSNENDGNSNESSNNNGQKDDDDDKKDDKQNRNNNNEVDEKNKKMRKKKKKKQKEKRANVSDEDTKDDRIANLRQQQQQSASPMGPSMALIVSPGANRHHRQASFGIFTNECNGNGSLNGSLNGNYNSSNNGNDSNNSNNSNKSNNSSDGASNTFSKMAATFGSMQDVLQKAPDTSDNDTPVSRRSQSAGRGGVNTPMTGDSQGSEESNASSNQSNDTTMSKNSTNTHHSLVHNRGMLDRRLSNLGSQYVNTHNLSPIFDPSYQPVTFGAPTNDSPGSEANIGTPQSVGSYQVWSLNQDNAIAAADAIMDNVGLLLSNIKSYREQDINILQINHENRVIYSKMRVCDIDSLTSKSNVLNKVSKAVERMTEIAKEFLQKNRDSTRFGEIYQFKLRLENFRESVLGPHLQNGDRVGDWYHTHVNSMKRKVRNPVRSGGYQTRHSWTPAIKSSIHNNNNNTQYDHDMVVDKLLSQFEKKINHIIYVENEDFASKMKEMGLKVPNQTEKTDVATFDNEMNESCNQLRQLMGLDNTQNPFLHLLKEELDKNNAL